MIKRATIIIKYFVLKASGTLSRPTGLQARCRLREFLCSKQSVKVKVHFNSEHTNFFMRFLRDIVYVNSLNVH
jgi:hypothetical protein